MTCAGCVAYDYLERAAIEGRPWDIEPVGACTCDDERQLHVLFVSASQLHRKPQLGTTHLLTFDELEARLCRPTTPQQPTGDDDKDKAQTGGYSIGLYRGNHRDGGALVVNYALAIDVDGNGDVDRVAALLGNYRAIIHSTYKSTPLAPRARIIVELAAPVNGKTYKALARIVCAHLTGAGLELDEGASADPTRLSYWPMIKPGMEFEFRSVAGKPLDAAKVLAAQPAPKPRKLRAATPSKNPNAAKEGALRWAIGEIQSASPGDRHATLLRVAWWLAHETRGLTEQEILDACLDAFVGVAGEPRRHEGERAIVDAFHARRAS